VCRSLSRENALGRDGLPSRVTRSPVLEDERFEIDRVVSGRIAADDLAIGALPDPRGQPRPGHVHKNPHVGSGTAPSPALPVDGAQPKPVLAVARRAVRHRTGLRRGLTGRFPGAAEIARDLEENAVRDGISIPLPGRGRLEGNREVELLAPHQRWQIRRLDRPFRAGRRRAEAERRADAGRGDPTDQGAAAARTFGATGDAVIAGIVHTVTIGMAGRQDGGISPVLREPHGARITSGRTGRRGKPRPSREPRLDPPPRASP
jgi:hypothetical protein